MIPSIQAEAYNCRALRKLAGYYESSLSTHSCGDLIELTMSIYEKKQFQEQQKRRLRTVDEKFMRRAEALLLGELAAALNRPEYKVPEYITARVDEERKEVRDERKK